MSFNPTDEQLEHWHLDFKDKPIDAQVGIIALGALMLRTLIRETEDPEPLIDGICQFMKGEIVP